MNTQIAPPPTDTERLRALAGRLREALSRDGSFKTRTSMEESHRASRDFFKALDDVLAKAASPVPTPPSAELLFHMAYELELVPRGASVPNEMLPILQRQYLAAHLAAAAVRATKIEAA